MHIIGTDIVNLVVAAKLLGVSEAVIVWWWRCRALRGTRTSSGFWSFKCSDLESFASARGLSYGDGMSPNGRYLSVPKLADYLGLTEKQVRLDIDGGGIVTANLPPGRTGRRTLWVSRKVAERLKEQLRQNPQPRSRKKKAQVPA